MKVTLDSTTRIVEIITTDGTVAARVWEGVTEHGVRCYALIPRIACRKDADSREFERELAEQRAPSPEATMAFPSRVIL